MIKLYLKFNLMASKTNKIKNKKVKRKKDKGIEMTLDFKFVTH